MKTYEEFQNSFEYFILDEKNNILDTAADISLTAAEKAGKLYRRVKHGKNIYAVNISGEGITPTQPTGTGTPRPSASTPPKPTGTPRPSASTPPKPTGTPRLPGPKSSAIVKAAPSALARGPKPNVKIPGLRVGGVASGVLGAADEKMKGSGWLRSLARGATVGTGAVLGGLAGGAAGTAVAPGAGTAVGGYLGQAAGAAAADKAFDVAAGANAKERAARRQQNRQSQSGGGLVGTGGPTNFSQKGKTGFISTGTGANRRTAQLASTSVVKGPDGKLSRGHLAFKTDPNTGQKKAVYKRADTSNATLARTSSNPWERFGRTINPGAYTASDSARRIADLQRSAAADAIRQRQLGLRNSVGHKIVGQGKVGPAIVGPKK